MRTRDAIGGVKVWRQREDKITTVGRKKKKKHEDEAE